MTTTAQIPNQNNIIEIIKSNVSFLSDVTTIIANAATTINSVAASINNTSQVLDHIYGEKGIFYKIESINARLEKSKNFNKNFIKQKFFKLQLKEIIFIINFIKKINDKSKEIDRIALETSIKTIDAANHIISILDQIKVNPLLPIKIDMMRLSLWRFRVGVLRNSYLIGRYIIKHPKLVLGLSMLSEIIMPLVVKIINKINEINLTQYILARGKLIIINTIVSDLKDMMKMIASLSKKLKNLDITDLAIFYIASGCLQAISYVLSFVDETSILPTQWIKLKIMESAVPLIFDIIKDVIKRSNKIDFTKMSYAIFVMTTMVVIFKMLDMIKDTISIGILLLSKMLKVWIHVYASTEKIFDVFDLIVKRSNKKSLTFAKLTWTILSMTLMVIIFRLFKDVMKSATVAALLSVPFSLLAIPLFFSVTMLYFILESLELIGKQLSAKMILKMLLIVSVAATLAFVGMELFVLALVAKKVLNNFHWILLLMLGIMGVVLMIIPLCLVSVLLSAIAPFAITGLFALTAIFTALIIVAYELKLLEQIQLNKALVMNNVDVVLSTCRYIIDMIFSGTDSDAFKQAGESKSWLGLATNVLKGSTDLIKILAASAMLFMTMISVSMILITVALLRLMTIEILTLDKTKVLSAVDSVIQLSDFIVTAIFGMATFNENTGAVERTQKYKESNFFTRLFGGIGDLVTVIGASIMLTMTFVSVGAIFLMLGALRRIQEAQFDEGAIIGNVQSVIRICKSVIDTVNAPSETQQANKKDGVIGKILGFILPSNMKYAIDAISSMPFIAFTWINIGMIKGIIEGLKTINDLSDLSKVEENITNVLSLCKNISIKVDEQNFDHKEIKSNIKATRQLKRLIKNLISIGELDLENIKDYNSNIQNISLRLNSISTILIPKLKALPKLNKSQEMILSINDISNILEKLTKFSNISLKDAKKGLKKYIDLANNISESADNKQVTRNRRYKNALENIGRYGNLIRAISGFTNTSISDFSAINLDDHERFMNNNIRFLEKINEVDSKKLRQTANIYKEIRHFSESINGNFAGLTTALSERLLPVLEELKEIFTSLPNKIDQGFQNTSASIAAVSAPVTKENVTAQIYRENPNLTAKEVDKIVATRMNEKAQLDANGLIAKIDELISLFKGYGGEHAIVQTI